ncbi:MAG: 2'-5' RNA ligase family protein [Acidobacteria bacterium]|nr:2'-5' RNA ligase family protein [Acidobacteriota bacterium]
MGYRPEAPEGINCFALVTYLPSPLGSFLNSLRQELVPTCHLRSHVTVLPPRQLPSCSAGWDQLQRQLIDFEPVYVELDTIEVFPETSVIYVSIGCGRQQLIAMHQSLAQDDLAFCEPFVFHPHITLAQGLLGEQVEAGKELARHRWANFTGPRGFMLDAMTFVQNTVSNDWVDLGELSLGAVGVSQ